MAKTPVFHIRIATELKDRFWNLWVKIRESDPVVTHREVFEMAVNALEKELKGKGE